MKNVFKILLAITLSFTLLFSTVTTVFASTENFTTFTEVDAGSKITKTADKITFTGITHADTNEYVYKDFGAGYFDTTTEFNHYFSVNLSTAEVGSASFYWTLSNDIADFNSLATGGKDFLTLEVVNSANPVFSLLEYQGAFNDNSGIISTGTEYYIWIYTDPAVGVCGTLYCKIYTDAERTVLFDTLSIALSDNYSFRYLFPLNCRGGWNANIQTGYVENLDVNPVMPATVDIIDTTVTYNTFLECWRASVTANITSGNGDTLSQVGFWYKLASDSTYDYAGSLLDSENQTFHNYLYYLEHGETYDIFAQVVNEAGTSNSTVEQFYVGYNGTAPAMQTLSTPLQINISGNSAVVYGLVEDYGGDNVTAWFQWKASTSANWTTSGNTTDLITNDTYYQGLTGLTVGTSYDYFAVGQNVNGISYGAIRHFTFVEIETPEVTTIGADNITSTSAWLYGTLDYTGDSTNTTDCTVMFRYKPTGTSTWFYSAGGLYQTGDNVSFQITSLTPLTSYDYSAVAFILTEDMTYSFGYGETMAFDTFAEQGIPIVITGNVTYASHAGMVRSNGTLYYDGGLSCSVYHQIREKGLTYWDNSNTTSNITSGDTFWTYITGLSSSTTYQYRWVAYNTYGTGYGSILEFTLDSTGTSVTTPETSDTDTGVLQISQIVNNTKTSLGLTGIFGSWAFLGLVVVAVALCFGVAFVVTESPLGKKALAFTWILAEIAVVGAFLFSGELGVWPLVIMVGGTVLLLMIVLSVKLSGSTQNG